MKKILKILASLIVIIVLVCIFYTTYSAFLESKIEVLYKEKENLLSTDNSPEKNRGSAWIDKSISDDTLVVFGSSELDKNIDQNIKNNFPNDKYKGNVSCIGTRHVQNLVHSIDIGGNYNSFKGKNLVLIESMQWFYGDEIKADGFMANFSKIQFYKFMRNSSISEKNKIYLCNRFLNLEETRMESLRKDGKGEEYDYPKIHIYAKLYTSKNYAYKAVYQLIRPYYYFEYKVLSLKDKYNTYKLFKDLKIKDNNSKPEFITDWDMQLDKATEDGRKACTNNDILVNDAYYDKYFRDRWDSLKDSKKDMPLLKCNEWNDYKFLLSVCKELGLKPYIINTASNPRYYDYIGITKDKRDSYYERIDDLAKECDMPIYNGLIPKENEPYVYLDVMHLGWRGWIYVTKSTVEYFGNNI